MNTITKRRIIYRACYRCHGDLMLDQDNDYSCLQCGRVSPIEALVEQGLVPSAVLAERKSPNWALIAGEGAERAAA